MLKKKLFFKIVIKSVVIFVLCFFIWWIYSFNQIVLFNIRCGPAHNSGCAVTLSDSMSNSSSHNAQFQSSSNKNAVTKENSQNNTELALSRAVKVGICWDKHSSFSSHVWVTSHGFEEDTESKCFRVLYSFWNHENYWNLTRKCHSHVSPSASIVSLLIVFGGVPKVV